MALGGPTQRAAIPLLQEDLRIIVARIVEAVRPERIVLFGSAAGGTFGPDSDLDLLVIKRGNYSHIQVTQELYRALRHIGYAKDIIVVTPEEAERYKDSSCLVLYPALREGKVIYDREAV